MPKSKMQSGYMELEEKCYIFTYDGELLQLVPKEQSSIKPYDSLANKNIYLKICGTLHNIFVYRKTRRRCTIPSLGIEIHL